jgi:hypothetical protein
MPHPLSVEYHSQHTPLDKIWRISYKVGQWVCENGCAEGTGVRPAFSDCLLDEQINQGVKYNEYDAWTK